MDIEMLSINEWEALAFFGNEPISREYGSDWYDSDSCYEVKCDKNLTLTFAIHPIHKDVRLCLFLDGVKIYDWQAVGVKDICYIEEERRTLIKVEINNTDYLELLVSPQLEIKASTGTLNT